jgi:hypothetical protein
MNALDAFHSTVHSYPGGCEALAARMGVVPAVLRNKANPNFEHNKPTLADADLVMALSGNFAVLHALALNHGHVCVKVETDVTAADMAIFALLAKSVAAHGDVGGELYATLADGIVEPHEVQRFEEAAYRATAVLKSMVQRLKGMVQK